MDLSGYLTAQVLGVFVVFARMGSVMLFMPGFGDASVPPRHRLIFAMVLSIALFPATPVGPLQIETSVNLIAVLGIEVAVGLWIGVAARILMLSLQFAGYQIGTVSGLANAFAPSTGAFEGATMIATALLLAGTTLIFVTDLHYIIIEALLMSYEVFPPGDIMPGDLAEQTVKAVGASFYIGTALTAPFYVMGLVLNAGLGLANRMMPTLPVFFVAAPVLIAAGLFVLVVGAPSMLTGFLSRFADWFATFTI